LTLTDHSLHPHRRHILARLAALSAAAALRPAWALSALTELDASQGVKAALEQGASAAVALLGAQDGFWSNALVRIGLPPQMEKVAKMASMLGLNKQVEDLRLKINRAAEAAVPHAKTLLVDAVRSMSVEDAVQLVRGGDNAATAFFERKTRSPLYERFLPIVSDAVSGEKLVDGYNALAKPLAKAGLLKGDDANLQSFVTDKSLDGLFTIIGQEEKKIRANPAQAGVDILRKVFGK
jgi:hypothetical protein